MINVIKIKNGCNCYLVEDGKAGILIDVGMNNGANKIIQACKGIQIKRIILTHGHMDHIQCAPKMAEELHVPIMMHERDLGLITNNLSQPMYGRKVLGKLVAFFSTLGAKTSKIDDFKVSELIAGEKMIQEGEMNIEIVELPGHTKGSIGIKIENHFFVGDALMNMAGPDISLLYENMDDLLDSAMRITSVGDVIIHFGHGDEVSNRQWV
jgi:glyoxylase-like metal-dependent hydrolase (beta-lactamase superfamily II)